MMMTKILENGKVVTRLAVTTSELEEPAMGPMNLNMRI